jgi:hypothetical protein
LVCMPRPVLVPPPIGDLEAMREALFSVAERERERERERKRERERDREREREREGEREEEH